MGFLGDDWFYFDVIARADNALVSFAVYNERFTRPLVAFIYYLTFRYFGLSPVPGHIVSVLLHVFNAWLVTVLVLRLAPRPNRLIAAGAGSIFLVFAGHSEAIAWLAGLADAVIVPFFVATLLLLDRVLDNPRPARAMCLGWIVAASAFLAKETAMITPALAAVYAASRLEGPHLRRQLSRTIIFVTGVVIICGAYWMFRTYRFGSALGAYADMGTSEGHRIAIGRMFLLRTFVPPGRVAVYLWTHYLDLLIFMGIAAAVCLVVWRDRASWRGLAFAIAALGVALAPVLPLSISLTSTLSERYLYPATVFSAILTAWIIVRLLQPRLLAVATLVLVAAGNVFYLQRSNRTWVEEDAIFRSVVSGLRQLVSQHGPPARSVFFLLNMPDTIERPFVDGGSVWSALRHTLPEWPQADMHVRVVAMHTGRTAADGRVTTQSGRFTVDVGDNTIVPEWLRDTEAYAVVSRSTNSFTIEMKPSVRRAVVGYWAGGEVRFLSEIPPTGLPFGSVDLPPADPVCQGSLRFAGWALDETGPVTVMVSRQEPDGSWSPVGQIGQPSGARADVTAAFYDFASSDRAGWDYSMPCDALGSSPTAVRVVAADAQGNTTVIGTRVVSKAR